VDLATVDLLARAALHSRRAGVSARVVNAPSELRELIALAGLENVLLGRDGRQPEQREQPLDVEEGREAHELTVRQFEHL
jgi:anti-anti-sigma regulatory factor